MSLALTFTSGSSTAFALAILPLVATAAIIAVAVTGGRFLAAVPPTL
ncbi:hypothetical protein [Microbacterium testaceum]